GFELVDEIVRFERLGLTPPPDVPAHPTRDVATESPTDLEALVAIDHAAFPWLWWNSPEELRWYGTLRNSQLLFALEDDRPVAYPGFPVFHDDGPLDRRAVLRERAGHGYGAALMREAFSRLRALGARRVALTTQADNLRAQRLYRRFGFRRTSL